MSGTYEQPVYALEERYEEIAEELDDEEGGENA